MAYRKSVVCVSLCAMSAGMFAASSVDAGVIGHRWAEIDNSTSSATGAATGLNDGSLDGNIYRTFDLFVEVTAGVLAFDSGFDQGAGPNSGILITNTNYYQFTTFGASNLPPLPLFLPSFPLLEYDSYVGIGDLLATQIGQAGLTFSTNKLEGAWFAPGGAPAPPNEAGEVFVGRFTVESKLGFGADESADRFLGGQLFVALQGAPSEITTVVNISNAFATTTIPSPGAMPFAALMGLAALRRRRN